MMEDAATTTPLLSRLLGHAPARAAVRDGGGTATYGDLAIGAGRVAAVLRGGRRSLDGARVAVLLPPGRLFVEALLGIWRAGGVAVPLSAAQTRPELEHVLGTAGVAATIVDGALAAELDELALGPGAHRLGLRVDAGALAEARGETPDGSAASSPSPSPSPLAADPALMLFTSGTTGKPKGVVLSHAAIAATLRALHEAWRWTENDRLLHALPLYHTHGLIVALLGGLWAGAAVTFAPFEARGIWSRFAEATVFMAVPTMYVKLMETFAAAEPVERARWARGARALRLFTSGSAALPARLMTDFAEATGQIILERYGMTEIGMALSNRYDGPRVPGAVGVPLPEVGVDIVDETGAHAADGAPGELRVRSPQLFLGYQDDPEATAASHDEAGRFRTGDTAVRGPDGLIRILGRTSVDILKSGGYKLSALEIEDVLRGHPAVAEVAVIGVPDPTWGDRVTACVVLRAGASTPTLDELRDFARRALAPYKLPRELRVLPALPRNPMGKVQKSRLT